MDNLEWSYSQVVGHPDDARWSQVLVLPQTHGVFHGNTAAMWLAFSISGEKAQDEVGPALVNQLEERFGQGLPLQAKEVILGLKEVFSSQTSVLSGLLILGDAVYLLTWNGGRVVLHRGSVARVLAAAVEGVWTIKQGVIQAGDRWLIGTADLVDEMEDALLVEVLSEANAEEAGQSLAMRVQSDDESEGVAGVLLYVDEAQSIQDEEVDEVMEVEPVKPERIPQISLKDTRTRKASKSAFSVGLLLLALLGVSMILGWQQRMKRQDEVLMEKLMIAVQEVQTQAPLVAQVDRQQALGEIDKVEKQVATTEAELHDRSTYETQLSDLISQLAQLEQSVSGRQQLGSLDLWYSLSLISKTLVGTEMMRVGDALYVMDGAQSLIAYIGLANKQGEVVAGGSSLQGVTQLAGSENRLVALAGEQLVEVDPGRKNTALLGKVEAMPVFALEMFADTVYTLEGSSRVIRRYGEISSPTDWLSAGVVVEIDQVVDMDIDGDVWLLGGNGAIERYRRGQVEGFEVVGLDKPFSASVAGFDVGDEVDRLYVLDQGNARVVALSKNGEYLEQFEWEGLAAASDVVFDEERNQLLVLVGEEIYLIPLG